MALKDKLNFRFIWGLLMVVIYLGMFILLVFTNVFVNISSTIRIIIGAFFLVYAAFRSYSLWQNGR